MTRYRLGAAICILLLAAAPALADETTDSMKNAKALYRQGSLAKTFAQLEVAVTLVARQLSAQYAKTLPPAPNGWRTEPVRYAIRGKHRIGRGLVLSRNYFQNGGRGVATVQVNIDQQNLIETSQTFFPNKRHATVVKRTLVPIKGAGNAFVKFSKRRGVGDLYIFLAGRFYINVSARNVESADFMVKLLSTWDFPGLKRTAGTD